MFLVLSKTLQIFFKVNSDWTLCKDTFLLASAVYVIILRRLVWGSVCYKTQNSLFRRWFWLYLLRFQSVWYLFVWKFLMFQQLEPRNLNRMKRRGEGIGWTEPFNGATQTAGSASLWQTEDERLTFITKDGMGTCVCVCSLISVRAAARLLSRLSPLCRSDRATVMEDKGR